jgi:SAM-dependent methyltransferase
MDPRNALALAELQAEMVEYYAESPTYYKDINRSADRWLVDPLSLDIVSRAKAADRILEIGCGSANILQEHRHLAGRYYGCDFSPAVIGHNQQRYPEATFRVIENPQALPCPHNDRFDMVFSTYVIEHTIYPARYLDECVRVLRPGGEFVLLCPNFLGADRMTSQRAGFSSGNGAKKLREGRFIDALVTGWDRRVAIPRRCRQIRKIIGNGYGFWINLAPVCFTDAFLPDVDAVYLTYENEIRAYLSGKVRFESTSLPVPKRLIYMAGKKV